MSKNKIIIDLRRIALTDKQRKNIHEALHKAVLNQLKKNDNNDGGKNKSKKSTKGLLKAATSLAKTANLKVDFTSTNPTLSELKAILNNEEQTITKSGTITFNNVQPGDIIIVQGESLGTTLVTIDISADPTLMTFKPGHFNDNFFIN